MNKVKEQSGSCLFLNNFFLKKGIKYYLVFYTLLFPLFCCSQIANYVANGSFEQVYTCTSNVLSVVKFWNVADSIGTQAVPCDYYSYCFSNVPSSGASFQYPKSGSAYIRLTPFCSNTFCSFPYLRSYAKNRLKNNLVAGKTYCVKMYVNLTNTSPNSIDGLGILFSNNTIDTVKYSSVPLTFLNPQIQNPTNNLITDTLNWTLITGTFIANGSEKFLTIGNYKSDVATTKSLTGLPSNDPWSEYFIDDVSCIPLDLPAYAGADTYCVPGNTVYIGRPQDVGIDEACTWYNITNTITPIGNAAGIVVSPITTSTYIVKQDICGVIKYDTVVVHASGVGIASSSGVENSVKIYPNPVNDILNVDYLVAEPVEAITYKILNSLGQLIREEDVILKNNSTTLKLNELPNGVYLLNMSSRGTRDLNRDSSYRRNDNTLSVSKRFVINR